MEKSNPNIIEIPQDADGQRLDRWLKTQYPNATFANVQKACRKGLIKLDGKKAKSGDKIKAKQTLRLPNFILAEPTEQEQQPKKAKEFIASAEDLASVKSWIVYEDDTLIAINKPAGLPSQAGTGHNKSADRLLNAYYEKAQINPRLVHRLDKVTSGLLVFAKTRAGAENITEQLRRRQANKVYVALVEGQLLRHEGLIDQPLNRPNQKVIPDDEGQSAVTEFEAIDSPRVGFALLKIMPKTGRTHQIRAHMAYIETPIVGDGMYGSETEKHVLTELKIPTKGIALHAQSLELIHPQTKKEITLKAPLPAWAK